MPFHRRDVILGGAPSFPGGIRDWSAVYRAGTPGDSPAQFTDYSGNGLHATQATVANQADLTVGIGARAAFNRPLYSTQTWWTLPAALSVNRRSHGIYFVGRTRSTINASSRCLCTFGPGLTDFLLEFTGIQANKPAQWRSFGSGTAQTTPIWGRSGLTVAIISGSTSNQIVRINGEQATLTAMVAGSSVGGNLGKRTDAQDWGGEIYEFGVVPRPFAAGEITALETDAALRYGRPLSPPNELVFTGDSLTEGQLATDGRGWPRLLDDALGASWRQLSEGQTAQFATQMATFAAGLAATFDGTKTKHVAIWQGGINDIKAGTSASTVLGNVQTWLTAMTGAGWTCLVNTMVKTTIAGFTGAMETQRQAYNSGLPGLTGITTIVDVAGLAAMSDPTNLTYFVSDGLHWTNAGHAAVAALVQTAILAV